MKISGFSFVRNGTLLYLPFVESMNSIMPICDEFVMAVGAGDADDKTRSVLENLHNPKLRLVDTTWDLHAFPKNTVFAHETDKAMRECTGDWLFYIQGDEAVHEKYLPVIESACRTYLDEPNVEGFLFRYQHFWGDYQHVHHDHGWYNREIRMVRNLPNIRSWRDAQGFRHYNDPPNSYEGYRTKEGNRKLRVVELDAEVYHYGFVRPPDFMQRKAKRNDQTYAGKSEKDAPEIPLFNYGDLSKIPLFRGTHPSAMKSWIAKFNWADQLANTANDAVTRPKHKHERLKNKILTWIETKLLGGKQIFTRKNYVRIGTHS